jgi:hypothetical protein
MMRRLLVAASILICVLGPASPALADPATPTNYRSTVETVEPDVGFTAEIIGGDAFVRLTAPPGLDLVVLGYEGEPYIWFRGDGTVLVNQRSPATFLNDDRYAAVTLPPEADTRAEPDWEPVASGGSWSWHDHRTHWMARTPPGVVDEGNRGTDDANGEIGIFDWTLPLVVDDEAGAVEGRLVWVPAASPVPWIVLAVVAGSVVLVLGRRRSWVLSASVTVAAAAAAIVGIGAFAAQPADIRTVNVDLMGPMVALMLGSYALWRAGDESVTARRLGVVAAAALGAWALLRIGVLQYPLLPTVLPYWFDRLVTASSLGVAAGAIAGLLVASARSQPEGTPNVAGPEPDPS